MRCGETLRESAEIFLEAAEFGPDRAEVHHDVGVITADSSAP
jgi:hypothetical protein